MTGFDSRSAGAAKRSKRAAAAAVALATAIVAAAPVCAAPEADGANLSDITITATRAPLPLLEAPATVTIIRAEAIADTLASDVRDLVRFEPGVSVRRAPSRFGAAQGATGRDGNAGFAIRGLDGNRVLIQVDGVRVPDGFDFGAQAAGRGDYVDLGLVKSVEILRGPASALFGSDGLAGVVSFTTTDPEDLLDATATIAGLARGAYDSADNQWAGSGVLAGRSGAWSALVSYTRRQGHELDNQGENDAPNSTRTRPNPQDSISDAVLAKLVFAPTDAHKLRLTYEHLDTQLNTHVLSAAAPIAALPTSVLDLRAEDTTRRDRVSLDWRYEGSGTVERAMLVGYWQNGRNRQQANEDRRTAADRIRINTFDNRVWGVSGDVLLGFQTGALSHRLVIGGDVSVTRQEGLRDGTIPTPPDTFPTRAFPVTDFTLAGVFAGDEIRINEGPLVLFPALRFDHYSLRPQEDPLLPTFRTEDSSGSRVSPKLGATLRLGQGASLVASYARGFKAPSPSQVNQFFENPSSPFFAYITLPNPDLKPETSESLEGGLRVESGPVAGSFTAFTGKYRNFISQEQVGGTGTVANPILFQYINLARVKISGLEARFKVEPAAGFTLDGAVAWAEGTSERDGAKTPLLTIDPLTFVAGAGYRDPQGRFGSQLIATLVGQKEARQTRGLCTPACLRSGSFAILDATAFVRVGGAFTLRAGLFNILDAKYTHWADIRGLADTAATRAVADAYTQPGRNVSVSVTALF